MLDHVKLFGTYLYSYTVPYVDANYQTTGQDPVDEVYYINHTVRFMALEDGNGAMNTIKIINLETMEEDRLYYNINDLILHEPSPEDLRKARQIGKLILL